MRRRSLRQSFRAPLVLCGPLGLRPADIWAIKQGNGGVTVIDYPHGVAAGPVVSCLNLTAHLGGVLRRMLRKAGLPDTEHLLKGWKAGGLGASRGGGGGSGFGYGARLLKV